MHLFALHAVKLIIPQLKFATDIACYDLYNFWIDSLYSSMEGFDYYFYHSENC